MDRDDRPRQAHEQDAEVPDDGGGEGSAGWEEWGVGGIPGGDFGTGRSVHGEIAAEGASRGVGGLVGGMVPRLTASRESPNLRRSQRQPPGDERNAACRGNR